MTEQEWLVSDYATGMLYLLSGEEIHEDGHITPLRMKGLVLHPITCRKSKLFACACCRLVWPLLVDDRSRKAVIVAEQFVDGEASEEELHEAVILARNAWFEVESSDFSSASYLAWAGHAHHAVRDGARLIPSSTLANLLRDVVGNPFRPLPPKSRKVAGFWRKKLESWVAWNGGTIRSLAQAIYDDRAFYLLPILADALEDAGCDNPDILRHCRGKGPHVRGCWAVDLILGKS
jgi:hypothetical protein